MVLGEGKEWNGGTLESPGAHARDVGADFSDCGHLKRLEVIFSWELTIITFKPVRAQWERATRYGEIGFVARTLVC